MSRGTIGGTAAAFAAAGSLVAVSSLSGWVATGRGAAGVVAATTTTALVVGLVVFTQRIARRRMAPVPFALVTLGSGILAGTFAASVIAVIGMDGVSTYTVGWARPRRLPMPLLGLSIGMLAIGVPAARRVEWTRLLQARGDDHRGPLRHDPRRPG